MDQQQWRRPMPDLCAEEPGAGVVAHSLHRYKSNYGYILGTLSIASISDYRLLLKATYTEKMEWKIRLMKMVKQT